MCIDFPWKQFIIFAFDRILNIVLSLSDNTNSFIFIRMFSRMSQYKWMKKNQLTEEFIDSNYGAY